jgi:hypothetical protein
MYLSRRSLLKITAGVFAFYVLPVKSSTAHTTPARFNWNKRVLRAEWRGQIARSIYYKKHQMARYRPYVQTASR